MAWDDPPDPCDSCPLWLGDVDDGRSRVFRSITCENKHWCLKNMKDELKEDRATQEEISKKEQGDKEIGKQFKPD